MRVRVTEVDEPRRFVDEQLRGPFAAFRHEHRFSLDGDGVLVEDRLTFSAPFGVLGSIAEPVVARVLAGVLRDRATGIERSLGGGRHTRET